MCSADKDAGAEAVWRIPRKYWNGGLSDNWPGIHFGPHEVNRTPGDFDACGQRLFVRMQPFEIRQQRRVDVDHPRLPALTKPGVISRMKPASAMISAFDAIERLIKFGLERFARFEGSCGR